MKIRMTFYFRNFISQHPSIYRYKIHRSFDHAHINTASCLSCLYTKYYTATWYAKQAIPIR